ncbi:hypothetical protein ACFTWS_33065 [Streptomyces sp. NPDC057027]
MRILNPVELFQLGFEVGATFHVTSSVRVGLALANTLRPHLVTKGK